MNVNFFEVWHAYIRAFLLWFWLLTVLKKIWITLYLDGPSDIWAGNSNTHSIAIVAIHFHSLQVFVHGEQCIYLWRKEGKKEWMNEPTNKWTNERRRRPLFLPFSLCGRFWWNSRPLRLHFGLWLWDKGHGVRKNIGNQCLRQFKRISEHVCDKQGDSKCLQNG